MASLVSRFAQALSPDRVIDNDINRTHFQFLRNFLLPTTIKIQKELRGRRFREVQAKLQEAVLGINGFATEEWPPGSGTSVATKDTLDTMSEEFDASEVDTESVVGDFSRATQEDDLRPFDDVTPTTITPAVALSIMEDDPKTREPMHPSIVSALEAYVQVMYHPSKTNRACELSLECVTELVSKGYVSGRAGGRDDGTGSGSAQRQNQQQQQKPANGTPTQPVSPSLLHMVMDSVSRCSESNLETVQSRVVKAVKAIMTSPKCGIHEATMLLAVRSTFHIYLVTKSPICRQSSKMALLDVLQSVFFRMEAMELVAKASSPTAASTLGSLSTSQFHTDSFVLLRSLCKLSSKELPGVDDNTTTPSNFLAQQFSTVVYADPLALSNKVLSLELIQALMECAGDAFCNGEKFIHLVQTQLCVALLKNCMSNHTTVAFLSQKIFLILVYKFKSHLKTEIELFMSNIFLRVLESPNASFKQKALVLESLRSLCYDPVLLTQIFLTYDCDFDAMNLYKDIVFNLTKLGAKSTAQPISNLSKKEAEQHFELSLAAVEVLVSIFKSFLKALGLPGGDNKSDDTAGAKIRSILQLDAGLSPGPDGSSVLSTDLPISYPHLQQSKRHIEFEASISNLSGDSSSGGGLTAEDLERHQLAMQNSSANVAGKIVDAFNSKRNAEQNFELGSVKFTLSLKSGINFFVDNGFVTLDAKEIANFFLVNKDKLDKTQMGEVLGREPDAPFDKKPGLSPDKGGPGFFVRILHHYADAMDFTSMMFDDAIRLFLSGFRLPGEAQKIDRIMEKFAERFTRQNLDIFPSADTAFILAFSVIMLNTDLHNPSIKPERRMTLDSFLRNNRGIGDNGADLPEDFLTGIFERIKKSPFSLKEDDAQREKVAVMESSFFLDTVAPGAFFGTSAEERKREKFKKEREEMVAATEQLIRRRASNRNVRVSVAAGAASSKLMDAVAPADVVKPMFDVTWGPMIGILSQVLECSDDERSIAVCLNGFVYAIRIAAHSGMSLARDTFINSLAKFTFLGSIKEMKRKNIESIRTLLSIAVIDGEYFGESWGSVLQCISQLARLRMTASGLYADDSFLKDGDSGTGGGSAMNGTPGHREPASDGSSLFRQPTKAAITRETEENNGKAILEAVNEVLIEKVFSSTVNLSAQSLAHFITQLVAVSSAEIEGNSKGKIAVVGPNLTPRNDASAHGGDDLSIFSLQRLVEVADYNMDVRPRLVWTQVWDIMAGFYSKAGCHRNAMVSVFAIDSLKQLSFKFLDKPESSEFNFQRNFLNPFLQVMENVGTREDIRELILQCVDNIIRSKSHNLQSGWKVFFSILTASASDSSERINFLGLNILQRLLDEHLDQLCLQPDELAGQKTVDDLTPLEKRNRNANAEDFIGMCRASLAFVQRKETDSPRPMGSSIRALCHTAIFADILAERRVPPPVSGAQFTDPNLPGYTYEGLKSETESLEMILWRPLFEGLAEGIRCTARSRAGVVGCLVQRGSVLAIRAILLRHGSCFTIGQLAAILQQTLMPAVRIAVANDQSPVVNITSESPSVTSLDFLADPLPLPPPADDEELLKFEEVARKSDCAPSRRFGAAELLVEASFTDMRHGGDGDVRRAYEFAKKEMRVSRKHEQPFPDSWIATTAPIALGLLTDISSEIVLHHGAEGRRLLWPCIGSEIQRWCNGDRKISGRKNNQIEWAPCEALVRIAGREIDRFCGRLGDTLPSLSQEDSIIWANYFCSFFEATLSQSLDIEKAIHEELLLSKRKSYTGGEYNGVANGTANEKLDSEIVMLTPFGKGSLVEKRVNRYKKSDGSGVEVTVNVVRLGFGVLYCPVETSSKNLSPEEVRKFEEEKLFETDSQPLTTGTTDWRKLVPTLKIRCIAAHCLQQSLFGLRVEIMQLLEEDVISVLLGSLNRSRQMSDRAVKNEDLAHAFQEAVLTDWGFGDEMAEEALMNVARLSHTQGSAMFFLTQSAGATNVVIRVLRKLYETRDDSAVRVVWDREKFAVPHLLSIMKDVLHKFVESEAKQGHLIDPNVWRNPSASGGKVAVYCTSFASVVVEILKAMLSFEADRFERHKQAFFPMICKLIRAQSDAIRELVQQIMMEKFSPMLGVDTGSEGWST